MEDEVQILRMCRRVLEGEGYTVIAAGTPQKALELAEEKRGALHLVVTDVVMPAMNGRELATRIKALVPGVKTLFMSGYTANVIAGRGVLSEDLNFIQKPFSSTELASKIREALDNG
ncbi:MAG: response regulator [Thermoleophilia bacterium]|nr:response regulator [Thermoleophilia bacterium]